MSLSSTCQYIVYYGVGVILKFACALSICSLIHSCNVGYVRWMFFFFTINIDIFGIYVECVFSKSTHGKIPLRNQYIGIKCTII